MEGMFIAFNWFLSEGTSPSNSFWYLGTTYRTHEHVYINPKADFQKAESSIEWKWMDEKYKSETVFMIQWNSRERERMSPGFLKWFHE